MTMSTPTLCNAIKPLRLIFWGGLLCIFDFQISQTMNGSGWSFDFLNDFVGMLMILCAVGTLRTITPCPAYRKKMNFVKLVAILACIKAAYAHAIFDTPTPVVILELLLSFISLVAIIVFCSAMRQLCAQEKLREAQRSWTITLWLFVCIFLIPLGLFYIAGIIAIATEQSFYINLGPAWFLLLIVLALPMISLFLSTSKMRREIESMTE